VLQGGKFLFVVEAVHHTATTFNIIEHSPLIS
jgi:hypothetical protein